MKVKTNKSMKKRVNDKIRLNRAYIYLRDIYLKDVSSYRAKMIWKLELT